MRDAEPARSRYRPGTRLRGMPSMIQLLTLGGVVSATIGVLLLISHRIADGPDARRRPPIGASEAALRSALPAVRWAPGDGEAWAGAGSPLLFCRAHRNRASKSHLRYGSLGV